MYQPTANFSCVNRAASGVRPWQSYSRRLACLWILLPGVQGNKKKNPRNARPVFHRALRLSSTNCTALAGGEYGGASIFGVSGFGRRYPASHDHRRRFRMSRFQHAPRASCRASASPRRKIPPQRRPLLSGKARTEFRGSTAASISSLRLAPAAPALQLWRPSAYLAKPSPPEPCLPVLTRSLAEPNQYSPSWWRRRRRWCSLCRWRKRPSRRRGY